MRATGAQEASEVVGTEEFPLDNRFGTETLAVEHELSKTYSNSLTVGVESDLTGKIDAGLLSVIKSQISARFSERRDVTIGETVSRRDTIKFSVRPGDFVVYSVSWTTRTVRGEYIVSVNGDLQTVNYEARAGLAYAVQSRLG